MPPKQTRAHHQQTWAVPAVTAGAYAQPTGMTPMSSTTPNRPLRRDAAENRDRLLAAAAKVFDAQGLEASVAEIARAAGVGMGTLYRRFPTKDALIDALVHDVLEATTQMAQEAAQASDGTGLELFLEASSRFHAEHPGCLPRLWDTDHDMVRTARRLISGLLADAQLHARVRNEVTTTDITLIMLSIRGLLAATRPHAPGAWHRHLELLVAGMRPASEGLVHPPLSQDQLDKMLTTRGDSRGDTPA